MSKITYTYLIGLVLALFATSCTDELAPMTSNEVGKDVIVKVPIELPGMEIKSRADLYDYQINQIESVWIRTYAATGSGAATMNKWKKIDASTITLHEPQLVENLATKSGPTYIVAVANVTNAKGVKKDDQSLTLTSLATLLDEADSWDKFLNIAVATPSEYYDVNEPPTPLVMAGCFLADSDTHPDISGWQSANYNFKAHDISATDPSQLKGTIHLRRVVSQMTFNLIPGPGIKITPNSYRVVNVPVYSWLYERDSTNGKSANFGDGAENADDAKKYYYKTTNLYPHNNFEECEIKTTKDCYKFSFWQAENKHTGTSSVYNDRQIKTGTATNALFTSLTGDTWTPNNMASYVIINCNIDHDGQIKVDNDGQIDKGDKEVYRSGNADYIIHLGYLGSDATDFNAYRNTKYTYNVYINGIDKIRVEAYNDDKKPDKDTNGVEGLVTDIDNPTYMLDCHYHSYNIQLTETDLNNFGFIITTYDSGIQHTYQESNFPTGTKPTDQEFQYISWVELRPTTDATTLAEYKPRTGGDEKTFNLLDASRGLTSAQKSTSGWYTVFVNEYTYEGLDGKEQDTDWRRYVNQPSRRFYIRVTRKISPDGHSLYATSKYAGIQRSIQTYYSEIDYPTTGGVLGMEHENEVLGLNVGRTYTYAASDVNGRYNVWCWLNGITTDVTLSPGAALKKWDDVIVPTKMQHIYPVDKQGITIIDHDATLPSLINGTYEEIFNGNLIKDETYYKMLPQGDTEEGDHWLEAVNACMNRNRDNNGNGTIEPEELRWYVPAKSKYLRMILGKNALTTPLTNYDNVSQLVSEESDSKSGIAIKDCTRLMNFTSDGHAILSFNGTSSSNWAKTEMTDIASSPWNVRCVRNLGTDLSTITKEDKTIPAYEHDETSRTVSMKYYGVNAYRRAEMFSGNGTTDGTMPVHIINETRYNRPFQKFQYSEGRHQLDNKGDNAKYDGVLNYNYSNPYNIVRVTEYINQNPCKEIYGDGWRLPNISELSIMRNIGLFDDFYTGTGQYINRAYLLSCTKTYYDSKGTGYVLSSDTERNFLGVVYDNTVEILANAQDNQSSYYTRNLYFRCVRDVR